MQKSLVFLGLLAAGCSASQQVPQAPPAPAPLVVVEADPPAVEEATQGQVVLRLPGMV